MDVPLDFNKRFICVEHPSISNDSSKLIRTLGDPSDYNQTFNVPANRLELRFRPGDLYSKPALGDRFATKALLLKVRRPKWKNVALPNEASSSKQSDTSTDTVGIQASIVGYIDAMYKFQCIADCQYLPMSRVNNETPTSCVPSYKSLIGDLKFTKLEMYNWMDKESHLFLPPPMFCRMDMPQDCLYRDIPQKRKPNRNVPRVPNNDNVIRVNRRKRGHYVRSVAFAEFGVPTEPMPEAIDNYKHHISDNTVLEKIKEKFEEHPIWSKYALAYTLKIKLGDMRYLLPVVSYYLSAGPWRTFWIRLGYDPRLNVESKKYQMVDFRMRNLRALDPYVQAIRDHVKAVHQHSRNLLPNRRQKHTVAYPYFLDAPSQLGMVSESCFRFRPNMLPNSLQTMYQICEINLPSVQDVIHSNDGKETVCTEKDGWCVENYQTTCRELMLDALVQSLKSGTCEKAEISTKDVQQLDDHDESDQSTSSNETDQSGSSEDESLEGDMSEGREELSDTEYDDLTELVADILPATHIDPDPTGLGTSTDS